MDNELLLFDRVNAIKDTINKYGEENFYLSFSGGKDSTILHYLLDMALPNNQIPRVYINTGIEYNDIVDFVKDLASKDDRFIILKPEKPIKQTLEKYGYPFKSKEHSLRVEQFNKGKNSNFIYKYINGKNKDGSALKGNKYVCPKILLYQFAEQNKYNYSNLCCKKLKKDTVSKWSKANNKSIYMTGMRSAEGGQRVNLNCIITKNNKLVKFHPLVKVDDEWETWFIEKLERERVEYSANSTIHHITLKELVVRVAHLH